MVEAEYDLAGVALGLVGQLIEAAVVVVVIAASARDRLTEVAVV